MKRPELIFLNEYEKGRTVLKQYDKRVAQGLVSHTIEIRRSLYLEKMEIIREAISKIENEDYRQIVTMKVVEGKSIEEIARIQGATVDATAHKYYRAVKKIQLPEEVKRNA